ncbi:polyribonucleotide nucleotidyltransferase [Nostoc sp.]|uniref:polyribonucleotide nucleotidyltransferase n=1 Tax=Nostoc sp. TaxID=1180 RepID=UPI002FFC11D9
MTVNKEIRQLRRKIMGIGDMFRNIVGGKQKQRDEEWDNRDRQYRHRSDDDDDEDREYGHRSDDDDDEDREYRYRGDEEDEDRD